MLGNLIYNFLIDEVTDYCYQNCLEYFPDNSSILDVGIGNGTMLENYHSLIKRKNLRIIGIDKNKGYLKHCGRLVQQYQLGENITLYNKPIELLELPAEKSFDFILFSMSFMLLKDQHSVLDRVGGWLSPDGEIVFFQTMFRKRSKMLDFIKPKIKYFTSVDFGRVTYEDDFSSFLRTRNLAISHDRMIKAACFKGEYRMIATHPANGRT